MPQAVTAATVQAKAVAPVVVATTDAAKRYFEFVDGKSSKFWEITAAGQDVTVRYGKIGTASQSQTKSFPTTEAASNHLEKLVQEKIGKGYVEA